jgi:CTP:molybdopterin cytidylyltransferase MocA
MITLVDRPPASASTLCKLVEVFEDAIRRRKWAAIPEYQGRHGHPFIIGRELMEAFLKAPASSNAREIEHQHAHHLEYVPLADPAIIWNVDRPEDYALLSGTTS